MTARLSEFRQYRYCNDCVAVVWAYKESAALNCAAEVRARDTASEIRARAFVFIVAYLAASKPLPGHEESN